MKTALLIVSAVVLVAQAVGGITGFVLAVVAIANLAAGPPNVANVALWVFGCALFALALAGMPRTFRDFRLARERSGGSDV